MEEQLNIEKVYRELKELENTLKEEGVIKEHKEICDITQLSDKSLAKDWLSPEDEETWKDL